MVLSNRKAASFLSRRTENMPVDQFARIKQEVESNGGVKTFELKRLRDAHGAAKTGPFVLKAIEKELSRNGLGHSILPQYQDDPVRLYILGTRVADILDAANNTGAYYDDILMQTAREEAHGALNRIKQISDEYFRE